MRVLSRFRAAVRRFLRRSDAERDLDAELATFVSELADEYRRRGLPEGEARRAALLELGGMDRVKESVRGAWAGEWVHTLWRDVRLSFRSLGSRPAFTAVTVLTLSLGIGGATAVFSVVDAVLFEAPPGIDDAKRVVAVNRLVNGTMRDGLSYPELTDLRTRRWMFQGVAAHVGAPMRLRTADDGRRNIIVDFATGSYFELLGVEAAVGRLFGEVESNVADPRAVLVLSHRAWTEQFGGAPDIVGRSVELTGTPYTVVGVAEEGFEGTMTGQRVDGWAPLPMIAARGVTPDFTNDRSLRFLSVLARLRDETTVRSVRQSVGPPGLTVAREFGRYPELREADERFFGVVGSAVSLLLLLACANVASLLLLRAAARRHELAARLALGASRGALARRLVVESSLLVAAATIIGALGADLFVTRTHLVAPLVMSNLAYGVDARVLAFSIVAASTTVLFVSILPVLQLRRIEPMTVLRTAVSRGGGPTSMTQRGLVVGQVAVSLALVATASSVLSDMREFTRGDPGFDTQNLGTVYFDIRTHGYNKEQMNAVVDALTAAAAGTPDIESVTLATAAPLVGRGGAGFLYHDGGRPTPSDGHDSGGRPDADGLRVRHAAIHPSYFSVLGVPLLRGRSFGAGDGAGAEEVAIVTRALAQSVWGSESVVGEYVEFSRRSDQPPARLRVVGVAADHKHSSLWESEPVLYLPLAQAPLDGLLLIARGTTGTPLRELGELLRRADPVLYPDAEWTTDELIRNWTASQRRASISIGLFGLVAIVLSALGVYGAVGHVVTGRLRELAVRSALGARPHRLTMLAMREGLVLAAAGLGLGGLLLFWTQAVARRSLDGVGSPALTVVVACVVGVAVAMVISSYLPTRRLRSTSLVSVLRRE